MKLTMGRCKRATGQSKRDVRLGKLPPRHLKQEKGQLILQKAKQKQQEARSGHVSLSGKQRSGASSADWAECGLPKRPLTAPAGLRNVSS